MAAEYDFLRSVDDLSKTYNKRLYEQKARRLINKAFDKTNSFYPYRLALELDRRGFSTSELENYIIKIANRSRFNLRYLVLFPLNIMGANVSNLEKAVMEINDAELLAEFSQVPYSNTSAIEELILNAENAKASYIFINFHKNSQIEKHKKILIRSKKSRYLYKCATLAKNKAEFEVIENLLLKNKSNYYIRLIATLPFANLEKIENRIIATENFEEIKKLYKITKSHRLAKYVIIM
jgi:hypothetical protein